MAMQLNCGRVAQSAQSIGLGDRFRYWRGVSGRRYLFSAVNDTDLNDLANVVLIVASVAGSEPQPVWLGEVDAEGIRSGFDVGPALTGKRRTFVHFLAGSDGERCQVLRDLIGGRA